MRTDLLFLDEMFRSFVRNSLEIFSSFVFEQFVSQLT